VGDYFNFKSMVSPVLIKVIYFLGFLSLTVSGVVMMTRNQPLEGLSALVFGNLLWRITCEGIIIIFRIHESLVSIEEKQKTRL
jgi:hypothetical protein